MKKRMMAMAAAMALGAGVAGAQVQAWQDENGTLAFTGCYKSTTYVQCEVNYTLTKSDSSRLRWENDGLTYYLSNGTTGTANTVSVAGGGFYGADNVNIIKGVPVKAVFRMELPSNTNSILALVIEGKRIDNVPIRASATAAATPAPRPAATTPAPVNTNAYNAVMTNCTTGAGGVLTCNAVLTPRR